MTLLALCPSFRLLTSFHPHHTPGLAAGFDKDAEAIRGLLGLGLGFMEVGEQ